MQGTRVEPILRNVSPLDRGIRLALGAVLLLLPALGLVHGLAATSALLFAWVPLVTGATGWCPVYTIFGIRTLHR
jgi:hypothetical protein